MKNIVSTYAKKKHQKEEELAGSYTGAQIYREDTLDELSKRMLTDYMGKSMQAAKDAPDFKTREKRIHGFKQAYRKREVPRKESATGHIGNSSGPSPANPLGSNSPPMEAAGDSANQPLYVKVIGDTSPTRRRQAKAADKVAEAKEQQPANVVRNYVAKAAQRVAKGSGRHNMKNKYQRQAKHRKMEEDLSWDDVNDVRKHADDKWNAQGANVKFTRHFLDRVNDERNKTPITKPELERLVDKEAGKYGNQIPKQSNGHEGVMVDRKTKINMPFVVDQQTPGSRKDIIAKTVMRKDNFMTSNRKYPVESVQEGVKVKMRSMREDEPSFPDGVGPGPSGMANSPMKKIDVRKGALYSEDDDGAYQMAQKTVPDDANTGNELGDKAWYAEDDKKAGKIDMRSKAFKEALKKAQERAAKRKKAAKTTKRK